MTIKDILMCSKNKLVKDAIIRFDENPYDFSIFGPRNLDDNNAVVSVYLFIGTDAKCELKVVNIDIHNGECTLVE